LDLTIIYELLGHRLPVALVTESFLCVLSLSGLFGATLQSRLDAFFLWHFQGKANVCYVVPLAGVWLWWHSNVGTVMISDDETESVTMLYVDVVSHLLDV
jgi:hypothetical protein